MAQSLSRFRRSNDQEPGHGGTLFLINVVARYLEAYNAAPFCRFRTR